MILISLIIIAALSFDFINGFHDTANAIATVISTRVLTPRMAIAMAAILNFVGAFFSQNVAKTIAGGILIQHAASQTVILCAIIGAIVWNLITWRFGIPSSSSHALIGGLVGAGFAAGGAGVIQWKGIVDKVVIPLIGSPIIGFILAFIVMMLIFALFAKSSPGKVGQTFRHLQVISAAAVAFSHGSNDAQKSMGIITLALVSGGLLHGTVAKATIPIWVIILCAVAMGVGTSVGGWRIIQTMGHRIIRLEPVNGFAAEVSASAVILGASALGFPVSTTHVISGCIFGVGAAKRLHAVRWGVAQRMVVAWVLTIPAAGAVAGLVYSCAQFVH